MDCSRCWASNRRRRSGLTLIEVLAGLVILGTLLVGVVLAKVRFARQHQQAKHRLEVVEAVDRLLTDWWQDPGGIVLAGSGRLPGPVGVSWRTRVVASPTLEEWGAQVVRLEAMEEKTGHEGLPLVVVDLVLPGEDEER